MAVGKNKRLSKGKKGKTGKKAVDPYSRKEWYDVKAPSYFTVRNIGKVIVNRTQGTKIASDALKGRVVEFSLADLSGNDDQTYRKMKLRVEDVQGQSCLTNFYGMDFTSDKVRSLVKKWQTMIEANVDIKTTDGYFLRVFAIAFTRRRANQVRKTTYAQTAQIRQIRKKMVDVITQNAANADLTELVKKFIPESIGKEIEKVCNSVYPLQNAFVRKVKVLKTPKFDAAKLLELHNDSSSAETGAKVERPADFKEPVPSDSV